MKPYPLEKHVCSLENAKKLKKLGVTQDSLFRWQNPFNDDFWEPTGLKKEYIEKNNPNPENYSAFTSTELGEMLPLMIMTSGSEPDNSLGFYKNKDYWYCGYRNHDNGCISPISISEKEADSRAGLLILLIENNLMEVTNETI